MNKLAHYVCVVFACLFAVSWGLAVQSNDALWASWSLLLLGNYVWNAEEARRRAASEEKDR